MLARGLLCKDLVCGGARISRILTNIFIVSGKPCFQAVGMRALEDIRLNMAELTKENVDLIILANMQQNRVNSSQTKQTATHTDRKERRRASVKFFLLGRQVCRSTYLFAHGVGIKTCVNTTIIMDLGQGGMVMLENPRTMHFQYLMNKA